jgi:hypothetical protein
MTLMRNLLVLFCMIFPGLAGAKNYYVSAAGNDANSGLSTTAPWQTIKKVNSYFSNMALR